MATKTSKSINVDDVIDVPENPFQPTHICFPSRVFRKSSRVSRSFQASWFNAFKWLHYDLGRDAAFCFMCSKALRDRKLFVRAHAETSYTVSGFTNWKDPTCSFRKHEDCEFHKSAVSTLGPRPKSTPTQATPFGRTTSRELPPDLHNKGHYYTALKMYSMVTTHFPCKYSVQCHKS